MFLSRFRLFAQIVGFVTIILLTGYGAFAAYQNADDLLTATGLITTVSAAPISIETTSLALQASNAINSSVPPYLNYQGLLRDGEGKLLSGVYDMTFRIYHAPDGGDVQWQEPVPGVTVREGRFSILLGNTTPLTDPTIFATPDTYLGVTVAGFDEMVPRQRFASVPYAVESYGAARADGLRAPDGEPHDVVLVDTDGNVQVTGNVAIANALATGRLHVQGGRWNAHQGNADLSIGSNQHRLNIGVATGGLGAGDVRIFAQGGTNRMMLGAGASHAITVRENRVGVNNTTPSAALDVNGDLNVTGTIRNIKYDWPYHTESHNGINWSRVNMGSFNNRICFLTRVTFEDIDNFAEQATCDVYRQTGRWWLQAYTTPGSDADAWCGAACLSWGPE